MIDYQSSGKRDRNGNEIRLGDMVRVHDGPESYMGKVVFKNCAFRVYPITDWCGQSLVDAALNLQYNSTLLFDEISGTSRVEVL